MAKTVVGLSYIFRSDPYETDVIAVVLQMRELKLRDYLAHF